MDTSGLNEIAGIDIERALLRFNGKEDLYRHWLADFANTSRAFPDTVERLFAEGNASQAEKISHAFKGRVGMLGMDDLHGAVAKLERELRDGVLDKASIGAISRMISGICEQLERILPPAPPQV